MLNAKIIKSLQTADESFFESMWIEIDDPLTKPLLINLAYCPNKSLSDYFLDQITVEISAAYEKTDILLFGDYNVNDKEQEKILDFEANSGLNIANRETPTRITNTNYTLIDYCFMSNDQIKDYTITDPPFHSDHMLSIFETNIRPEKRQNEDVYISKIIFHDLSLIEIQL